MLGAYSFLSQPLIELWELGLPSWMIAHVGVGFRMVMVLECYGESTRDESDRTTSRSESDKSFFKSITSPGAMLVSFMMSYESAMESQRYRQETLYFKTIDAAPKCETKLEIERHAT
ncbi:hypothetical protein Tco_1444674 [Tanacetum coccineum]